MRGRKRVRAEKGLYIYSLVIVHDPVRGAVAELTQRS